ncbi:phosphatidylserine decarboxylase proenzyme, mitochondrial isoform X1 [Sitophilus oryzae]|uniref:Phosphatidylserine decarboxylase proenzyme, mitochondrial n=2 Tax=Sitophilus oryzae TaxID=7048 RepID=A0A6J2YEW6_SITOR|nr:phosphatidylserine decarboxylase proenzyme, mitochondrial isoform X1 [Sitophilus oryzae]
MNLKLFLNPLLISTRPCYFRRPLLVLNKNYVVGTPLKRVNYFSTRTDKNKSSGWGQWEGVFKRFVPLGICLFAVMQWRAYRSRIRDGAVAKQWEINCYCLLPLRTVSRVWGFFADKNIPEFARPLVFQTYARTFGVDISEAQHEDLKHYSTLTEFFTRPLKEHVRIIDSDSCLVSPCDGTVLSVGSVDNGQVEQVKGVTYYVQDFLGEKLDNRKGVQHINTKKYHEHLLHKPHEGNTLYQCVIYLAPGDYHRFHSPADWKPTHRRHFSGELLSVNPRIAKWLPGLFVLNERAVYLGEWAHGFFSYTAVGATNVGSIRVIFDKTLQTNQKRKTHKFKDACLGSGITLHKGDLIGEFRMGSTIVIIFEAPVDFKFDIAHGQKVKMGQKFGCVPEQKTLQQNAKH